MARTWTSNKSIGNSNRIASWTVHSMSNPALRNIAHSSISYPLRKSRFNMALATASSLIVWVTASHWI